MPLGGSHPKMVGRSFGCRTKICRPQSRGKASHSHPQTDRKPTVMEWWRAYHGLCENPKLHAIAREIGIRRSVVIAAWVAICELASKSDKRGSTRYLTAETLSRMIDEPRPTCRKLIDAFFSHGSICEDVEDKEVAHDHHDSDQKSGDFGRILVKNWERFQRFSDDSSQRVRKFRRSKSLKNNDSHEKCNVTETFRNGVTETDQNRTEQNRIPQPLANFHNEEGKEVAPKHLAPDGKKYPATGSRAEGTNPRAMGTSLRQRGINPRALQAAEKATPELPQPDGSPIGDAWAKAAAAVEARHPGAWGLWLSRVRPTALNGSLSLQAPSEFVGGWIRSRFGSDIETAVGVPVSVDVADVG